MNNPAPSHRSGAKQTVYLVDDRPSDLILVQRLCENVGIDVELYEKPSQFLEQVDSQASGCLLVDLLMPEMSGLDLFNEIKQRGYELATVVITGFADAGSCRSAFQAGVFDFIEKDYSPGDLLTVIRRALDHNRHAVSSRQLKEIRRSRVEALTSREMDVAKLLSHGNALKEVGSKLSISVQTASKHRSNIFEKLHVSNEVELHLTLANCVDLLESAK